MISTCGTGAGWKFTDVQWPSGGDADSLQPAQARTINSNEESYFVATRPISGDEILLAKLSGDRANSPTLTRAEIDIPAYNAIRNEVNQPGSPTDLDGGKSKAISAVYVNRRVFFSLTTDVLCAYTLSAVPAAQAFSDITASGVTLNWSGNGNPGYTEFQVRNVTLGQNSVWINALSFQSDVLASGTEYQFGVRSRNGDDLRSDWVELGFVSTLTADTDGDGIGNICDADLSQDCVVNVIDLGILRSVFFSSNAIADLNSDGVVNVQDLGILRLQFFGVPGPSGVANDCAASP